MHKNSHWVTRKTIRRLECKVQRRKIQFERVEMKLKKLFISVLQAFQQRLVRLNE